MELEHARRLIDRIGFRHPCDLDLLLFFARHPRTLLTSEELAAWLGYELKQIAESLDVLLGAGLLTRALNPTHAARMYIFAIGGPHGGWLPGLLDVASTREGRLVLLQALARASGEASDPGAKGRRGGTTPRPHPHIVRRRPGDESDTKAG